VPELSGKCHGTISYLAIDSVVGFTLT